MYEDLPIDDPQMRCPDISLQIKNWDGHQNLIEKWTQENNKIF